MAINLKMFDHAIDDRRSCAAMLRGMGDNREQAWLTFEKHYPEIHYQEVLMEFFSREARCGRILPHNIFTRYLSGKYLLALTIFFNRSVLVIHRTYSAIVF